MPVPPPPTGPDFWSPSHTLDAPYVQYDTQTDYGADQGILQVPVAGPPGTACELIRLHAGRMRKTVNTFARRAGKPPVLPTLAAQNPSREVLAGFHVIPQSPVLGSDGTTYVFQVNAQYTFYETTLVSPSDGYRMTSAPYTTTAADLQVLTASNFASTIL